MHAADAAMAIENARELYTRRNEGVSIWVVRAADITASNPDDKGSLFDPAASKVYRHPTFFPMPDEIKNQDPFQQLLFSKIVPNCKKLGLLDANDGYLRERWGEAGLLRFEAADDTASRFASLGDIVG